MTVSHGISSPLLSCDTRVKDKSKQWKGSSRGGETRLGLRAGGGDGCECMPRPCTHICHALHAAAQFLPFEAIFPKQTQMASFANQRMKSLLLLTSYRRESTSHPASNPNTGLPCVSLCMCTASFMHLKSCLRQKALQGPASHILVRECAQELTPNRPISRRMEQRMRMAARMTRVIVMGKCTASGKECQKEEKVTPSVS